MMLLIAKGYVQSGIGREGQDRFHEWYSSGTRIVSLKPRLRLPKVAKVHGLCQSKLYVELVYSQVRIMQRSDVIALLVALGVTGLLVWGLVYLVQELWPVLPPAVALIIFILLAVLIIGYPIYALARLSERYLARQKKERKKPEKRQK